MNTPALTIRLSSPGAFPIEISRRMLVRDFGVHIHDHIELFIVLNGSAVHTVDSRRYFIKAGDVYVIREGREHSFSSVSSLVHYNIGFGAGLLTALGEELAATEAFQRLFVLASGGQSGYLAKLQLSMVDLRKVEAMAEGVRAECSSREAGHEVSARARLLDLVVFLLRRYSAMDDAGVDGLVRLARAAARIEAGYRDELDVGELAALAGLSVSHFGRLFKKHYRISPGAYAQSLRLQHAAFLLGESDSPIGRVGMESGFCDGNYFARQFRRRYGMTPRAYRRTHAVNAVERITEIV